jgi:hypothetical protein
MAESIANRAILDDIDEDTFVRFCEYAYTGDYSIPPPTHVPESTPTPGLDFREPEAKDSDDGREKTSEKAHSGNYAQRGPSFERGLTDGNRGSPRTMPKWKPRSIEDETVDMPPPFVVEGASQKQRGRGSSPTYLQTQC